MSHPWIVVVGIGEDGLEGLTPAARVLVEKAELLVGGERHQAFVAETSAVRLTWKDGLDAAMAEMEKWRGRRVVVLASGDPMCFGAGVNLQRRFGSDDLAVLPVPGSLALACARMLWSEPDVEMVTLHGRPMDSFRLHVAPGARLVVLSQDGETPAKVAAMLVDMGYGPSRLAVLEHMGGPREGRVDGLARDWRHLRCADLNAIAVECLPGPAAMRRPRVPGLPDEAYVSDGQLTKREVRAVTLAALAPLPGELLWDLGAGSGSVAIEWLRAAPRTQAVAVEGRPDRCAAIALNAARLGVPRLKVVEGDILSAIDNLSPAPDAIFLGGGVARAGMLEACFAALRPGGRLVANAVTLEAERVLLGFAGGELRRIEISHPRKVGGTTVWEAKAPVTQIFLSKPENQPMSVLSSQADRR
ncbi:MAG: precorrin-6y C5,15-methyltransferase (decarboxylating) subunit CbiE [Magnetospirillum sp. WYHS-4]